MKYAGRILGGVPLMVFLCVISDAAILYVSSSSSYPTIQSGLDAASNGDIVLVASGTYYENIIWPDVQGIQLLSEAGPYYVRIDGDTAASVIQITTGVDSTTVINGFTLRNGYADNGGAVYCVNSSPMISNNIINFNESTDPAGGGGAIYCSNASPIITGNQMAYNTAAASGGAIYCESNSSPRIKDNIFYVNTCFYGGAICVDESSPLVVGNSFNRNTADSTGGGMRVTNNSNPVITENVFFSNVNAAFNAYGGGAITVDSNCAATITKNIIDENLAVYVAGAIGVYDGIIADNVITNNEADYAGGIAVGLYGTVTITGNTITDNYGRYGGGGIVCGAHSTSMIRDNVISNNTGEYAGGGIICDTSCTPTIRRNTISNNSAPGFFGQGAGIRCSDGAAPIIDSCIFTGNTGDEAIYCTGGAVPTIHYNEIENNPEGGVRNADGNVTVDAENNWWGDPSGPSGSGPGSGDAVSNYVDYDPWLTTSMSDSVPPATPYVLNAKAGNDAELVWNMITTDTLGNAESVDYYVIYRSTSPSFVPGIADSIGAVFQPETTYTDVNALSTGSSYYYLVKAVDWKKNVSEKSNMAFVFIKSMNENPMATDMGWTSLPW